MKITGVLLAAGTSSRMGSTNKLLLAYRGRTVIEEGLRQLSASQVDDILVVLGHQADRIEPLLASDMSDRVRLIVNERFKMGRAESIKTATAQVADSADAVLFMVADKPGVDTALIDEALDRYRKEQPSILYVRTPRGRGHPIIFSKALFGELLALEGDRVGEELVARYEADSIAVDDNREQIDIDTEADYQKLVGDEK
jgi:molybdenum cofactor cytidylyltransferase